MGFTTRPLMKFLRLESHVVDLTGVNYVNWHKEFTGKNVFIINLYNISGSALAITFESEEKCLACFEKVATALESLPIVAA